MPPTTSQNKRIIATNVAGQRMLPKTSAALFQLVETVAIVYPWQPLVQRLHKSGTNPRRECKSVKERCVKLAHPAALDVELQQDCLVAGRSWEHHKLSGLYDFTEFNLCFTGRNDG